MRTIEKIIVGGSTVFVAAFIIAAASTTTPPRTSPASERYAQWQRTTAAEIGRAAREVEDRERAEQAKRAEDLRVSKLQHRLWIADTFYTGNERAFCREIAVTADADCPIPGDNAPASTITVPKGGSVTITVQ
jgi:hypothetical protein